MKRFCRSFCNLLMCITIAIACHAQAPKDPKEVSEKSKIETFSLKTGSLFKKEFWTLGTVKKVELKKLVITDISTNQTLNGLRLQTIVTKSYGGDTKISFLDVDEVESFRKSAKYLLALAPSDAGTYIEMEFTSRGGFRAGAFCEDNYWKYFIQLKRNDNDSYVFLSKSEFQTLYDLVMSFK